MGFSLLYFLVLFSFHNEIFILCNGFFNKDPSSHSTWAYFGLKKKPNKSRELPVRDKILNQDEIKSKSDVDPVSVKRV